MNNFEGEKVDVIFNRAILISESEVIANCQSSVDILSDKIIVTNHHWIDDPRRKGYKDE